MRILVTGRSGYLGSALVPALEQAGHAVFDFDEVTDSRHAISSRDAWNRIPQSLNVQAVIHLAAQNDLYYAEKNPLIDYGTNYWGTMLAANYCVWYGANLIFASTDTVIGLTGAPISVYDGHKWAAEKSILAIPELESVVLRLATVYGPSPNSKKRSNRGIINRWIQTALEGGIITVYRGVADKYRDFIHIDDIVNAFIKALEAPKGSYQIGTGVGTSVSDMANSIVEVCDRGTVEYVPDPEGLHPVEYRSWISNAIGFGLHTGWKAKVGIGVGIRKTMDAFAVKV